MANLKKIQVGARISGELYEQFKKEMEQSGLTQTELLEKSIIKYFTPEQVPQQVASQRTKWDIDLSSCNKRTIAAFLELQDKQKLSFCEVCDVLVAAVERFTGDVETKYLKEVETNLQLQ